jgi:hypothetical protein
VEPPAKLTAENMSHERSDSLPDPQSPCGAFWGRIRLAHVVYLTAMLVVSVVTFEFAGLQVGVLIGVAIVTAWTWVFVRVPRWRALCEAIFVCGVLLSIVLPYSGSARGAARRMACSNNLRQIAMALHAYHDCYDTLPPAFVADPRGRPIHSWRVLILPFLKERRLYEQYRFDEPWNGPHNHKLAASMPSVYSCPADSRNSNSMTSYVAVMGPTTAWPGNRGRSLSEFARGTSKTLLILESHAEPVNWMEPRDVDESAAVRMLSWADPSTDGHWSDNDVFFDRYVGRNILMVDGSVQFIHLLPRDLAEYLLSVDVEEKPIDSIPTAIDSRGIRRPNVDKRTRFGLFVLLAIGPLPWFLFPGNRESRSNRGAEAGTRSARRREASEP